MQYCSFKDPNLIGKWTDNQVHIQVRPAPWRVLKCNECIDQLSNTHRSQRTAKVHDDRIISMIRKKTTYNKVKNVLKDLHVSLPESMIKRRIHQWQQRFISANHSLHTRKEAVHGLWDKTNVNQNDDCRGLALVQVLKTILVINFCQFCQ